MNETTVEHIKPRDLNQNYKSEAFGTELTKNRYHGLIINWICQFSPMSLWALAVGFSFWPIWFHSRNLNDMLGVWDKAALPWNCPAVA